jgi:hypothetical protein
MTTPEPDDRLPLSLERIRELILAEEDADADTLHLTANETVLSPLAQAAAGSPLQSRYLLEHLDMRGDSPSRLGNLALHDPGCSRALKPPVSSRLRAM